MRFTKAETRAALCDRRDCAMYKDGGCVALSSTWEDSRKCTFFKTKEKAAIDRERAVHRLISLGMEDIATKYICSEGRNADGD